MQSGRVCILYAGGTIGMEPAQGGYAHAPASDFFRRQLEQLAAQNRSSLPEYDLHEMQPLLDSANMCPADWVAIARMISSRYQAYAGFVVVHGTDTMAYTASALAFLLENLAKPVILTGAQVPLYEAGSDGIANLTQAILFAARCPVPEVCICFGGRLLRGCRSTKVSANQADAFKSPNYPQLGFAWEDLAIDWSRVRPSPPAGGTLAVRSDPLGRIAVLRLFPGITGRQVERFLEDGWDGLVLQTYGTGSGPENEELLRVFKRAVEAGTVITSVSQCMAGGIRSSIYSSTSALQQAGIISGGDMTTESAMAKLGYLSGLGLAQADICAVVERDLRGELTELSQ
jgi:L-asparaginase